MLRCFEINVLVLLSTLPLCAFVHALVYILWHVGFPSRRSCMMDFDNRTLSTLFLVPSIPEASQPCLLIAVCCVGMSVRFASIDLGRGLESSCMILQLILFFAMYVPAMN